MERGEEVDQQHALSSDGFTHGDTPAAHNGNEAASPTQNTNEPIPRHSDQPVIPQTKRKTTATPSRKIMLSRLLQHDIPRPPFVGQTLSRADIEHILSLQSPQGLDLRGADLRGIDLSGLDLHGVRLGEHDPLASESEQRDYAARLENAVLTGVNFEGSIAPGVSFAGSDLRAARFTNANVAGALFIDAALLKVDFTGAQCTNANFTNATMVETNLTGATFVGALMTQCKMQRARLYKTDFGLAHLGAVDLRQSFCDEETYLGGAFLQEAYLDGMRLRDVDLSAIDWRKVTRLGEELEAAHVAPASQANHYRIAARTYRHLGITLRAQGISEEGNRFLARSRHMETIARWRETRESWKAHRWGRMLHGLLRWMSHATEGALTGYGEHPFWVLGWAIGIIMICAGLFTLVSGGTISLNNALLLSSSELLGHGFADIPLLNASASIVPYISILEAIIGSVLLLVFVLALSRRTMT